MTEAKTIPDQEFYRPVFSPWLGYGEFRQYYLKARPATLVSPDRCWMLYSLCKQALMLEGELWECGVFRGGTAAMFAQIIADKAPYKKLRLFDTFEGMPETNAERDIHQSGDFKETSLEAVKSFVGNGAVTHYHQGFIPDTFVGLEHSTIALAHIDVDIWQSILDCCEFIFPRLVPGGFMIFDDYGFHTCPGARAAVDLFFKNREIVPLVLPTGQAIVFKSR
ncbi:TylF/MycF/NovP-related O-methyltransferase [Undibacterium fentianense]|uniref:Class I SAM-dependent methyltransferase n=1 Tax=Undibacterium fentianense TaxID=2828728 RepID=A0A941E0S2_9BURK|nr:TylF/MycF/NovP-related O-methyltransferase [Undibacterium fentianense]MBR7800255.1 class I SAM-dependent methyltransferase [Undibacterium fentianense]